MAAGVENKAESWNVYDKLVERNNMRMVWEENFRTNMEAVADKISESITSNILGLIGKTMSDPYQPLLGGKQIRYSLDLRTNVSKIKQWPQETANLPPFQEWFQTFEDPVREGSLDYDYFQEFMDRMVPRIQTNVQKNLDKFSANPQNAILKLVVSWNRSQVKPNIYSSDLVIAFNMDSSSRRFPGKCATS